MKRFIVCDEDRPVQSPFPKGSKVEWMLRDRQPDRTAWFEQTLAAFRKGKSETADFQIVSIERGVILTGADVAQENLVGLPDDLNGLLDQPICPVRDEQGQCVFPPTGEMIDRAWRARMESSLRKENLTVLSATAAAVPGPGLSTKAERAVIRKMGAEILCSAAYLELRAACVLKIPALALIYTSETGRTSRETIFRLAGTV